MIYIGVPCTVAFTQMLRSKLLTFVDMRQKRLDLWIQHISNGLGGFFLGGGGDMGVGVEGESGREVSQHSADRLNVHAVLQSYRGECMA